MCQRYKKIMNINRDPLGDRMKSQYENRSKVNLPRRTYTIIRLDGKAFHTFTRGCFRPFDAHLMCTMDKTAQRLCESIQGAKFAYVQSDEISILLTDFDDIKTDAWFDGSVQKIVSISASMATAYFNKEYQKVPGACALFDSRCFTVPDPVEVENYFVWRQQDAVRNSIQMVGQVKFSPTKLHGKSCDEIQEMLFSDHQINWNDYPDGCKRGRCVVRATTTEDLTYTDKRSQETKTIQGVKRHAWQIVNPPTFIQFRDWLVEQIPQRH